MTRYPKHNLPPVVRCEVNGTKVLIFTNSQGQQEVKADDGRALPLFVTEPKLAANMAA